VNFLRVLKEVLRPGSPEFKAHLTRASEQEERLLRCLRQLEDPATRDINASTDEAAEFWHANGD
jgi:hypothetical protein